MHSNVSQTDLCEHGVARTGSLEVGGCAHVSRHVKWNESLRDGQDIHSVTQHHYKLRGVQTVLQQEAVTPLRLRYGDGRTVLCK